MELKLGNEYYIGDAGKSMQGAKHNAALKVVRSICSELHMGKQRSSIAAVVVYKEDAVVIPLGLEDK